MCQKIIFKKLKKKYIIVLVQKHKVIDILGVFDAKKPVLDYNKIQKYVKAGCSFSKSAFDAIYKELSSTQGKINYLYA